MHPDAGLEVVQAYWDEFIGDAESIAEALSDDGWRTVVLHPGDVTPTYRSEVFVGLDVVVQGSEYEVVEALFAGEGLAFEDAEIYRTERQGVVFLVAVELDEPGETAVIVPLYYHRGFAEPTLEKVVETGEIGVRVRPLSPDEGVVFTHDDIEPFLPPSGG